jgi:hypothetical protein
MDFAPDEARLALLIAKAGLACDPSTMIILVRIIIMEWWRTVAKQLLNVLPLLCYLLIWDPLADFFDRFRFLWRVSGMVLVETPWTEQAFYKSQTDLPQFRQQYR